MLRLFVAGVFALAFLTACEPAAEIPADDPKSCEAIKADFPEQYEECVEALSR